MTSVWVAIGLQSAVILFGGVGLYVKIIADLSAIKARLEIDDKGKAARDEGYKNGTRVLIAEHCDATRKGCPALSDYITEVRAAKGQG